MKLLVTASLSALMAGSLFAGSVTDGRANSRSNPNNHTTHAAEPTIASSSCHELTNHREHAANAMAGECTNEIKNECASCGTSTKVVRRGPRARISRSVVIEKTDSSCALMAANESRPCAMTKGSRSS